jgi:type I restriction enzyme R subunit
MDKEMEYDNLIQAISRTNRIFDNDEKPWGMVKFYRKPETMRRNLDKALELYCQGDATGVQEKELEDNIKKLNELYSDICDIFSHDNIQNFITLPSSDADRQKFRKDFCEMKSTLRAAFLQGFKWSNEYASKLNFNESTYKILKMRFNELHTGGGGNRKPKLGFDLETHISETKGEQIDSAYLEARFVILTISDIERENKYDIVQDIKNHLGILPSVLQKYAIQVLTDIETKKFEFIPGKKFMEYISEYRNTAIKNAVTDEAVKFGLDIDLFLDIYYKSDSNGIDQFKLKTLENTSNINLAMEYFKTSSAFAARRKMHAEICEFIEMQKAEIDQ